jgi:hypothetical protein
VPRRYTRFWYIYRVTSRSQRGSRAAVASWTIGERVAALRETRVARALTAHPNLTAAGLVALLVLIYLWPALVGAGILAPTALLTAGTPWRTATSPELLRYINNELGDVAISYYPWDVLARQFIHSGAFPAWNPHALAGTPLFGNFEIAWLSPFKLPLWILPLNYGLGVAAALKLWMAGFGTYLLVRELRLGFWPALVAAFSFTLCAFNVVWLTYGVFVSIAALLPWALWLTERIVRRGRSADALWLALVVAGIASGGHPGTQVHVLAATALYALLRAALAPPGERAPRARSLPLVGAGVGIGMLLAAVVLLPAELASHDTLGAAFRRGGLEAEIFEARVPFGSLRSALFPEWWGRPSEHVTGGGSFFRERTFYAGVIPLALAALALASPGAWRRKAPFALLGALGTAVAVRTPLVEPVVRALPGFDQVQNQRMLLWFVFGVAILGAFGLEQALAAPRERRVWAVVGGGIVIGLCAAALVGVDGRTLSRAATYVVDRTPRAPLAVRSLASVAWALLLLAGMAGALLLLRRRARAAPLACALLLALVALDLLHFAHGYNPIGPASVVIPPRTPAIAFLQRHAHEGRIAGAGYAVPPDWSTMYGLNDVRGYDAPQPTLRFAALWRTLEPEGEPARITVLGSNVKVIGMLGGRYVIADPEAPELGTFGLRTVYRRPDAVIYKNELVVPRAFVPRWVDAIGEQDAEVATVAEDGFDPRSHAIVRRDELGDAAPPTSSVGTARVVAESNSSVTIRASLAQRGLVVLDDQWMPGWSVRVDGRPAPILQTDVVLRGVIVPAGRHEVRWGYRVPGLRAGAALSALGLLALVGWGGALGLRRRRPRAHARSRARTRPPTL